MGKQAPEGGADTSKGSGGILYVRLCWYVAVFQGLVL